MPTPLAQSIRRARRAVGLTQEQLAQRMGLKLQAVYRWEADHTVPSKRNMNMLLSAISMLNGAVAARLSAELQGLRLVPKERGLVEPALAAPVAPP